MTTQEFDYALHEAGDFDAITALWTHVVLVVDVSRILTFDDGHPVPDAKYGFYKYKQNAVNVAYPHPGTLTHNIGNITIDSDLFIGARADLHHSRHFAGRIAGLLVSTAALTEQQVACVFVNGEEFLPSLLRECKAMPKADLQVSFLGSANDTGGSARAVALHGNATTRFNGAVFDGAGDYATVANFEYASDASFTVSFWMTKEKCSGNSYEYLYSHHNSAQPGDMYSKALVSLYLACHSQSTGLSTLDGTVLRYNVQDDNHHEAMFDFSLHDANDFDKITARWLHVIMVVSPSSIVTYNDGKAVEDKEYGYYNAGITANNAKPTPSKLNTKMGHITLLTDIFVGGRADRKADRHFRGSMALLQVFTRPVSAATAECIFRSGDATLPSPVAIYRHSSCAPLELDVTFIGDTMDRSGNKHHVRVVNASVDTNGAHFDGDGDYITVKSFEYAADGRFTVAMWMTKVACTGGIYEYLYSHTAHPQRSISGHGNPNVNIYIGCESSGGGWSTLGGSVLRFNVEDDADTLAALGWDALDAGGARQ